jgi:hypothetical protein
MLDVRKRHQSTSTRSERAVRLDPKFTWREGADSDEVKKTTDSRMKEQAHRTRIAQDLHSDAKRPKTNREIRWQIVAKEAAQLFPEKGELTSSGFGTV